MKEFPKTVRLKIRSTREDKPRGTALVTGMPRVGKTRLVAELAERLVGKGNTFLLDFPEEEGTGTLADLDIAYATVFGEKDMDEAYGVLVKAEPKCVIFDGLGSAYWMFMKEKVPSGIPPEDHGKTWMAIATILRREITRFKILPTVEWFFATSLVWPDKDEITGKEGRVQVVLPGQLKSNIYGMFSYNLNLIMEAQPNGAQTRMLELQPTVRSVAGVRAPWSWHIPAKVAYDLSSGQGLDPILKALRIQEEGGGEQKS
jgi:hypothetical protein